MDAEVVKESFAVGRKESWCESGMNVGSAVYGTTKFYKPEGR